jgi:replicative DNA helicase
MNNNLANQIAEVTILTGVMHNNNNINKFEYFTEEYFSQNYLKAIFLEMLNLHKNKKEINFLSLSVNLKKEVIEDFAEQISDISQAIDTNEFVSVVEELFVKREVRKKIIEINSKIADVSLNEIEEDINKLDFFMKQKSNSGIETYDEQIHNFEKHLFSDEQMNFKATGFNKFDNHVKLRDGDTYIVAAATGIGKSTFTQAMSIELAKKGGKGVLFSLEMSKNVILKKQVANLLGVNYDEIDKNHKFRNSQLNENIKLAVNELKQKKQQIHVIDTFDIPIEKVKIISRDLKKKNELDFLVIDQIGHISTHVKSDKMAKMHLLSWEFRKLAHELQIPIIILCQLNRGVETETPGIHHIAESSDLARDASGVILLSSERDDPNAVLDVTIVKNRYGSNGKIAYAKEFAKTRILEM